MKYHRAIPSASALFGLLLVGCAERIDTFEEYLEVAWYHERASETQPAIAAYRKALQLDPAQPIAWYDLGVLLQSVGQNDEAVAAWTEAIKHNPAYVEALVNRGAIYAQQGRHDVALADYSAAITAAPEDFTARRNRATLYEDMQNLTEALADLGEALRIDPRDAETWLARGLLRLKLNDWNRAFVDFEQAAELDPQLPVAWHGLAKTLAQLGQVTDAAIALNRAQQLDPALAAETLDTLLTPASGVTADAIVAKSNPDILSPQVITGSHAEAVQFVREHLRGTGLETESASAPWDLQAKEEAAAESTGRRFVVRVLAGAGADQAVAWFSAAEVDALKAAEVTTTLVLVRAAGSETSSGMFEFVTAVEGWKPDPSVMQPAAWSLPVAIKPAPAAAEPVAAAAR
jgi:tetratricopeptide (TPR) repeat protein